MLRQSDGMTKLERCTPPRKESYNVPYSSRKMATSAPTSISRSRGSNVLPALIWADVADQAGVEAQRAEVSAFSSCSLDGSSQDGRNVACAVHADPEVKAEGLKFAHEHVASSLANPK